MKHLEFNIRYEVNDGCVMYLNYTLGGNGNITDGTLSLREVQKGWWQGVLDVSEEYDHITYGYLLLQNGHCVSNEWDNQPHRLRFNCVNRNYIVYDMWLDSPLGYYESTNLFRFFEKSRRQLDEPSINWYNRSVTFSLYVTGLSGDERLYLSGNAPVLGDWSTVKAVPMQLRAHNRWSVTFDVADLWSGSLEYKFIAVDGNGNVRWEPGENRRIMLPDFEASTNYFYQLDELCFDSPKLRVAGTVIPLFSLRSDHGWGIGDFGDIKLMADWLASTGQNILQLLPVNDTTVCGGNEDSYPYNCVSVFALNPIYADMSQLPALSKAARNSYYNKEREALNAEPTVRYAKVYRLKINYLRELFAEICSDAIAGEGFRAFEKEQQQWLRPYALFRFLSSRLHSNIWDWTEYPRYESTTLERVVGEYPDAVYEMQFHSYVQYLLYMQLREAHDYANSRGVALKGDIPIGVAPNGVDVWCDSSQFTCRNREVELRTATVRSSTSRFRQVLHPICSRQMARTGAFLHIIGMLWHRTVMHGGVAVCSICQTSSMPTALTIYWASSAFGRYHAPQRAALPAVSRPTGLCRSVRWPIRVLCSTSSCIQNHISMTMC